MTNQQSLKLKLCEKDDGEETLWQVRNMLASFWNTTSLKEMLL